MRNDDIPSFTDKIRHNPPTYVVRQSMSMNNRTPLPYVKVESGLLGVIPTGYSQLYNDNFTVQDEFYVHTDNNFSDVYRDMLLTFDSSLKDLAGEVIYRRGHPDQTIDGNLEITGNVLIDSDTVIDGDLDVYGTITHHGTFRTSNDFIILREQEDSALDPDTYAGIITHLYDGETDGGIIWGPDGIGRIGDIEYYYKEIIPMPEERAKCNGLYYLDNGEYVLIDQDTDLSLVERVYKKLVARGTTQALATRLDADDPDMVDGKLAVWDEERQIFTAPDFSYHQTTDTLYIDSDDKTISYLDSIEVDQNGRVSKTNYKTTTLHRTWRPVTVNGEQMLISIDDKTINFQDGSSIKIEQENTDNKTSTVIISIDNKIPDNTVESTNAFQFLYYNTEGIITGVKSTAYQQTLKINGNVLGTLYGTNEDSADIHLYGAEYQIEETESKRYLLGSENLTDMSRTNTNNKVYTQNGYLYSNDNKVLNDTDDQTVNGETTFKGLVNIGNSVLPTDENQDIGSEENPFRYLHAVDIYADTVHAEIDGNAKTADKVNHDLILENGLVDKDVYNGSETKTLSNYYVDRFTAQSIQGIKSFKDDVVIGEAEKRANLTITGNVTIEGDITQNGEAYITHAEHIYSTKDYIYLREGATGSLGAGYAGFEFIKYDGENNGRLVIDVFGTARVGDVGDEQPLTTRDEAEQMANYGLTYWNADSVRIKTITPPDSGYFLTAGDKEPVWINPADLLIGEASKTTHKITFDSGKGLTDTFDGSADKTLVDKYVDMFNAQTIEGDKTLFGTTTTKDIRPVENELYYIGEEANQYLGIYAKTFYGNATSADKTNHHLTLQTTATETVDFDGSVDYVLSDYYVDRTTNQTVSGNKTFTDDTQFNKNVEIDGTLGVDGATELRDNLTVSGNTTLEKDLSVGGTAEITGATSLKDTLTVDKKTTLKDELDVAKATALHDTLTVDKATTLKDTLTVEGETTHNADVIMNGTTHYKFVENEDGILQDFITFAWGADGENNTKLYRKEKNGQLVIRDSQGVEIIPDQSSENGYKFNASNFEPGIDNNKDLGTTTDRWKNLYLYGDVYRRNADGTMVSLTNDIQSIIDSVELTADDTANTITLYNNKHEVLSTLTQTDVRGVIATDVAENTDKLEFVHYNSTGLITEKALQVYSKTFEINGTPRKIITDQDTDLTSIYAPTESGEAIGDNAIIVWNDTLKKPVWIANTNSYIFVNNLEFDDPDDTLHILSAYQGKVLDDKKVNKQEVSDTNYGEVINTPTEQWFGLTEGKAHGAGTVGTGVLINSSGITMRGALLKTDMSIEPFTGDTYDLGSATAYWQHLYAHTISVDTIDKIVTMQKGLIAGDTVTLNKHLHFTDENALPDAEDLPFYLGVQDYGIVQRLSKANVKKQLNISFIESIIPTQASATNQLVDKNFLNSTVNSTAAYYITKDANGTQFDSVADLKAATTFYSGGKTRIPTQNDYCMVAHDEDHTDEITKEKPTSRYVYQGGTYPDGKWEFQFIVNKTSFTAEQFAAVNSGATKALIDEIVLANNTSGGNGVSVTKSGHELTIKGVTANTSTIGVAYLHKANDCTSYSSDNGGATPAAVKKAIITEDTTANTGLNAIFNATSSHRGTMSATDKKKLDAVDDTYVRLDGSKAMTGKLTLPSLTFSGTSTLTADGIYTRTTAGDLAWSEASRNLLLNKGALAWWNGAYQGTGDTAQSNLYYSGNGEIIGTKILSKAHAQALESDMKDKGGYVTKTGGDTTTPEEVSGFKKFTNGFKVGDCTIKYNSTSKALEFSF